MPTSPDFADHILWNRFRLGEQDAFAEIYQRYVGPLYNYGYKFTRDRALTQDAVQELFVEIWEARERLSPTDSIRFYLYRALRRKIRKTTEKGQLTDEVITRLGSEESQSPSIEDSIITEERLHQLTALLRDQLTRLPAREYEALHLRFYEELSYEQIGELMGVNDQSARNLISRAIRKLRQTFPVLLCLILLVFAFLRGAF